MSAGVPVVAPVAGPEQGPLLPAAGLPVGPERASAQAQRPERVPAVRVHSAQAESGPGPVVVEVCV